MKTKSSRWTASCLMAALCSVMLIGSCEEEQKPILSTISFSREFQTLTEGQEVDIRLVFDRPSPVDGTVSLRIETDAIYGKEFETNPIVKSAGVTVLSVRKGQEEIALRLTTADDSKFSGSRFVVLRITDLSVGIQPGSTTTHTLTIHDNEGPSIAFFEFRKSALEEDKPAGAKVDLRLSSPAAGVGSITLKLLPGEAVRGTHFTVDQELVDDTFTFNVIEGDTTFSFEVFPVDNIVYTGDFVLQFVILETSGVVQVASNARHSLTLKDDELPSVVQFAAASARIDETTTAPHVVDLLLSSPVKGEGTLTIRLSPDTAVYGVDFLTTPEAQGGFIILELGHDQASASFSVSVLDDESLTGNLTIPFSIYEGTGPIWPGAEDQDHVLKIVDNESPSIVGFTASAFQVPESVSSGTNVEIALSRPALDPGKIFLEVQGYQNQLVSEPEVEQAYSSSSYFYQIVVDVPKGADRVSFHVDPIDNGVCNRNSTVMFLIYSLTGPLTLGSNDRASLSILEDEPHLSVTLTETEGVLSEDAAGGKMVELKCSPAASANASIAVHLDYSTNFFSGRIKTIPEFLTYSSSGYPYGYLEFQPNTSSVRFHIVPIDDDKKNADFTEVFYFTDDTSDGHCVVLENSTYTLNFVDDDD